MGSDFTAADQAFLLIDIVVTLAALLVWVFWNLEKSRTNFISRRRSRESGGVRGWVRKAF